MSPDAKPSPGQGATAQIIGPERVDELGNGNTVVAQMTEKEARKVTAKIKGYVGETFRMLAEVHNRRGYIALGYRTFEEYAAEELNVSRGHAYRMVDHAKVVLAIESAAMSPDGDTPEVHLTEAAAHDIKATLPALTDEIQHRVAHGGDRDVVVPEVVAKHRAKAKKAPKRNPRTIKLQPSPPMVLFGIELPAPGEVDPIENEAETNQLFERLFDGFVDAGQNTPKGSAGPRRARVRAAREHLVGFLATAPGVVHLTDQLQHDLIDQLIWMLAEPEVTE